MAVEKLSAMKVAKLTQPGRYGDGGGLWLQVSQWGTKAWLFRFAVAGKQRQMGLGGLADVSLSDARRAAREARTQLREGVDPIEARKAKLSALRAHDAKSLTFEQAAGAFIKSHEAGWKSPKHAGQWSATLSTYAYPVMGHLAVAAVDTGLVMKILEADGFWTAKPETASRVRGRIEAVLDWAKARGHRSGENPARWKGHLDALLPAKSKIAKVEHHGAMPIDDVPQLLRELQANASSSSRALQFLILTASRTSETLGATWSEIDLTAKVWTVPAARMKSGREHRVPLPAAAIKLLGCLPREDGNPHLFLGAKQGAALSNMSLLQMMRGIRPDSGFVPHGFRSTFRDWCGERTGFAREVAEAALAHVVGDETERAYRRGDALEKRRRLMEAWAGFVAGGTATAKVIAIGRSA